MDRRSKFKSNKFFYQAPYEKYKYPRRLNIIKIDGEDVAVGPILKSILDKQNVTQQSVLDATNIDRRTFRDFIYDKPTRRNKFGPAAISQIMHALNITIEDIIIEVRAQRSAPNET